MNASDGRRLGYEWLRSENWTAIFGYGAVHFTQALFPTADIVLHGTQGEELTGDVIAEGAQARVLVGQGRAQTRVFTN